MPGPYWAQMDCVASVCQKTPWCCECILSQQSHPNKVRVHGSWWLSLVAPLATTLGKCNVAGQCPQLDSWLLWAVSLRGGSMTETHFCCNFFMCQVLSPPHSPLQWCVGDERWDRRKFSGARGMGWTPYFTFAKHSISNGFLMFQGRKKWFDAPWIANRSQRIPKEVQKGTTWKQAPPSSLMNWKMMAASREQEQHFHQKAPIHHGFF